MKLKSYIITFLSGVLAFLVFFAAFNMIVDPFGVFGDRLFDRYDYNMTNNPRIAKIGYLDREHERYDSYIIGCSKTALSVEKLNEYTGASFYNMLMYGGDMYDIEATARYIIENYSPKNIIVNMGLEEAAGYNTESDPTKGNLHAKAEGEGEFLFYLKYAYLNPRYSMDKLDFMSKVGYLQTAENVFLAESGSYNKTSRDVERISSMDEYYAAYPEFYEPSWQIHMTDRQKVLDAVSRVKAMCEENDVTFTLILSPFYQRELNCYNFDELSEYMIALAQITDYYNFCGMSPISAEPRYFYDFMHFRNAVGDMMLGFIYGDDSIYIPEGFGRLTTAQTVEDDVQLLLGGELVQSTYDYQKKLPVLMYHHFTSEPEMGGTTVSEALFREQLDALYAAGYTVVSFDRVLEYVETGTPLPEKPVVITIDDGYSSNLDIAYRVLKEYGASATVSVIGVSEGKNTYKDTGKEITPHFFLEQARTAVAEGVLDIQSHSYDMHMVEGLDGENVRQGVLKLNDESEEEYIERFTQDFNRSRERIEEVFGDKVWLYAYPYGKYSQLSEVLLAQMGVSVTLSTEHGINVIMKGLPQTLRAMKRINIDESVSPRILVEMLDGLIQNTN